MPRDAAGVYHLPAGNPVVSGTIISSTWANTTMQDLADALTQSVSTTTDSTFVQGKGTLHWSLATGGQCSIGPGNGDGSGFVTNNMSIGTWQGVGITPLTGGALSTGGYAWSCNARTGAVQQQGNLFLYNGGAYSPNIYFQAAAGAYAPCMRANSVPKQIEFVNGAGNALTMSIDDAGNNIHYGTTLMVGQATCQDRLILQRPGSYGEMAVFSQDGTFMYIRGRTSGGGLQFVNNAYTAVTFTIDDGGNATFMGQVGAGSGALSTDGNVNGPVWGGWLSNYLASQLGSKAPNGAQVPWNSGIAELAAVMGGNNTVDAGNPWVMEGIRVTTSTDINRIYPRVVWLRNA
jgi:hypothetical protein